MEPLALAEHGHDDRGRGHRERRADGQRRGRSEAEAPGEGAQDHRRDDDLRKAEPEHQPAHAPQSFERQFEPHREQQRDHAERGDAVDCFDVDRERAQPRRSPAERPEAVGPERDPGQQVAEHRTDAQPEEQRRDDARRHQEQQRLFVEGKVDGVAHAASLVDSKRCASLAGEDPHMTEFDALDATGEPRFNAIGLVDGRMLFVTYAVRGRPDRIRQRSGAA